MTILSEFVLLKDNRQHPIKQVRHFRELAVHLLTEYMVNNNYEYTDDGVAEFIMELVDGDPNGYSYYEALPLIAQLIYSSFTIRKNKGENPLSNHQAKQVVFILRKILQTALTKYSTK
jgi:hypothetical protein